MRHIYMAIVAGLLAINSMGQSVARFEDLNLSPGTFWNGSDQSGSFKSGTITFANSYNTQWGSWSGFAYSDMTDMITKGYGNQYSAITGLGYLGSPNYAVCYPVPSAMAALNTSTKISGFYITNSTYAYWSMKNGDQFSKKFGGESGTDPDFFKLMIVALDSEGKPIDTTFFYLADFRFSDPSKDYILNKWTWVDLKELKEASKLRFSLSSSDNSFGYMNTPSYFCMDDLNGEKPFDYHPVTYADFDHLDLGSLEYYNGNDQKGEFTSGNFRFLNSYNADWASWSGFAASQKTDKTTTGYANQYSAITGKGVDGTSGYAVAYPYSVSTVLFKDTILSGMYVTNSTYAYWAMKSGDAYSKKFGGESGKDPDYLILSIEGFDSNYHSTSKIEFNLADFTNTNNEKDYILDSWKWVSLQSLGRVSKLEFSLRSSDNSVWGMNTPGYFCMDNLNHEEISSTSKVQNEQTMVFPNPFEDHLFIAGLKENSSLSLTDLSGKIIHQYDFNSNRQLISGLDYLQPGIYILKITEGMNHSTIKLFKK